MRIRTLLVILALAIAAAAVIRVAAPQATPPPSPTTGSSSADARAEIALSTLIDGSDIIVVGDIVSVRTEVRLSGKSKLPFSIATIRVAEVLKGQLTSASTLEVRDLGGDMGRATLMVSDAVTFAPGEQVVLFLGWLGPRSDRYLSVVGLRDGTFVIVSDTKGRQIALNAWELEAWSADPVSINQLKIDRPLDSQEFLETIRRRLGG